MLTEAQKTTLAAALRAETNPGVQQALAAGATATLAEWCNTPHVSINAWNPEATKLVLFEAVNITKYDALSAGKRDAWTMMIDHAPIDFGRNKMRSAITDIWGAADDDAIFAALIRKGTNGETYLNTQTATDGGITALRLSNFYGEITDHDVATALRDNPVVP